jgi:hypothetical protein
MTLPDPTSYRDITSRQQTPTVTMKGIEAYLQAYRKTFDEKYRKLYEERYIRYIRVSSFDRLHYIAGTMWAAMRKSVSYKVDVSLDCNGIMSEA